MAHSPVPRSKAQPVIRGEVQTLDSAATASHHHSENYVLGRNSCLQKLIKSAIKK
jgi:hypothetical protein